MLCLRAPQTGAVETSIMYFLCGRLAFILVVLATMALSAPVRAEYRINVGDVLELSVAGLPDFRQTVTVDLDGDISVALAGKFQAADQPLSELRAQIQSALSTKVYRQTGPDGHEHQIAIKAPEVNVAIAEYKPIYLMGDVATPGERPYRPGMIVRQAVALAGGYDFMHFRMENPFLESVEFKGEYERLRTVVVKEQAHIARVRTELQELDASAPNSPGRDQAGLSNVPTYSPVDEQIMLRQNQRLAVDREDFAKEKSHLNTLLAQIEGQLQTLEKQYAEEQEGSRMDSENLNRMEKLYEKGTIPLIRYTDERRTVLLSSTRVLQTMASVAQIRRDRAEINRRMQKLVDQRKQELLDELQDAEVALAEARSKLQGASEKLLYTGTVKSQLTRGGVSKPQIVVFRRQKTGTQRIDATDDTDLFPGDVIEVTLHLDYSLDEASRAEPTR
jgi:polysaccharide biosynthesis/export protein